MHKRNLLSVNNFHHFFIHFLFIVDSDGENCELVETLTVSEGPLEKPKRKKKITYDNPNRLSKESLETFFQTKHFSGLDPVFAIYPTELPLPEDLERPPIPDWSEVAPEAWRQYPTFKPQFHAEFVDSLEPHEYWIVEDEGFEYKMDPFFVIPHKIKECKVEGKQGFLSIEISKNPTLILIIVFNAQEYAPHEILILASQLLPKKVMCKKYNNLYRTKETYQVYIAYDTVASEGMGDFWPKDIYVGFNDVNLNRKTQLCEIHEIEQIKNTLYEDIFIHIWTHFFLHTLQTSQTGKYFCNIALGMKMLFFDKFCRIHFIKCCNQVKQNLLHYEYWIVRNATIHLMRLEDFELKFNSMKKYCNATTTEVSTLEAAGVKGLLRRAQPTEAEWEKAMMDTIDIMEGQKPLKKIKINPPITTKSPAFELADEDDDDDFENNTH